VVKRATQGCVILIICASAWNLVRTGSGYAVDATPQPSTRPAGIAVVELFTSEGGSSCPPAEKVLGDLASDGERDGRGVIALAFHVDYWNRLGWVRVTSR
jgi:hypothetical protein